MAERIPGMREPSSWTPERERLLREQWAAGESATNIARRMQGITKNAVIGKAHRLGLARRPSPIRRKS